MEELRKLKPEDRVMPVRSKQIAAAEPQEGLGRGSRRPLRGLGVGGGLTGGLTRSLWEVLRSSESGFTFNHLAAAPFLFGQSMFSLSRDWTKGALGLRGKDGWDEHERMGRCTG